MKAYTNIISQKALPTGAISFTVQDGVYTGGDKKGQPFITNVECFDSPEKATKDAANRQANWGSNLVYLGYDEIKINDVVYYKNGFNLFD